MKHYDKEKVLKWYASLKETLKEAKIDINNPRDLARIKTYYFKELPETREPGNPDMYDDEKGYAFIPKTFDENEEFNGYKNPRPHLPDKRKQEELDDLQGDNRNLNRDYLLAIELLAYAYEKGDKAGIEYGEKRVKESLEEVQASFDKFRTKGNEYFADYYKWIFSNQTLFDPEKDYDQILELYDCAMEGRIYINPLDDNPENRWQLVVTGDGSTSDFSKTGAIEGEKGEDIHSLILAIDTVKKGEKPAPNMAAECEIVSRLLPLYEAEHGIIGTETSAEIQKISSPPAEVPKPGIGSWIKRILSFGFANGDFKRYDDYQKDLTVYNTTKTTAKADNLKLYEQVTDFLQTYHTEFGIKAPENTLNVATVENNRIRMHTAEFVIPEAEPRKEFFIDSTSSLILKHNQIIENEIADKPDNINEDGSFNNEKSNEYWKERGEYLAPTLKHDRDKNLKKLAAAKEKYLEKEALLQKEKQEKEALQQKVKETIKNHADADVADMRENIETKKATAEQNKKMNFAATSLMLRGLSKEKAREVMSKWTSKSVETRIKQIGTLFGAKPEEALDKGSQILTACITRNQEYNADGTEKNYSNLRVDREIIADINELLNVADHPKTKDDHKKLLADLEAVHEETKNKKIPKEMLYDSAASLLMTEIARNGSKEAYELGPAMYVCAHFVYGIAIGDENSKSIDISKDYKVDGGKNLTLSNADSRSRLFDLGRECQLIDQITTEYKTAAEQKEQIKNRQEKEIEEKIAPDLNIKRKQNLDLAR